jgi:glutamyl-tRNA reductase
MEVYFCGVNHRSAPVELRERLAITPAHVSASLEALQGHRIWREAVLLSTCNRTEIYVVADEPQDDEALRRLLGEATGVDDLGATHVLVSRGPDVGRHLMRVASGLDSQVLGEHQILGQVRNAQALARAAAVLGPTLDRIFNTALHGARRVHTETQIGCGAASVASAGIVLAEQVLGTLAGRRALVVGAGETGTLAARHLAKRELASLSITNRTRARAEQAARLVHADVIDWEALAGPLPGVDVVICATSAGRPVVTRAMAQAAAAGRTEPLVLIDLSMPRNVDPAVAGLPGVVVHALDALNAVVRESLDQRRREAGRAEQIIDEETADLTSWLRGRAAMPLVRELHAHFERLRAEEVARSLKHFRPEERERLEDLTRAIVHKLLQAPTLHLKTIDPADPSGLCWADAVRGLFAMSATATEGLHGRR